MIILCVLRILKIYSLSKFQTYYRVLLTKATISVRSPDISILLVETLYPFDHHHPISPTLLAPGNHHALLL